MTDREGVYWWVGSNDASWKEDEGSIKVVFAKDYDALIVECKRLRKLLKKHGIAAEWEGK